MDSFQFRNIKLEKAKAMHKYRRLQKVATLFRVIEVGVFLFILSRSSSLFPFAFKFSGEYFRGLFTIVLSPSFVFIIGNMIIIVLYMKSRQEANTTSNYIKADYYDEYVNSCQNVNTNISDLIKTQKRQIVLDEKISKEMIISSPRVVAISGKKIHRSPSESFIKKMQVNQDRPLRRSVTERCLESVDNGGNKEIKPYQVDEMSNEEFRSKVEAFIARQQRLLREE